LHVDEAVAVLVPVADSGVRGTVRFDRVADGVRVRGRVTGLTPGRHGFHVHEFGDLTDLAAGESAGDHFSTEGHGHAHGARESKTRHTGDLGNLEANADGIAEIDFADARIALDGARSILGRSLVVHAGEDTYGQPSGGAGPRVAVGVIGIARPPAERTAPR
jgi:Cu-Zn family superoxide dismutase